MTILTAQFVDAFLEGPQPGVMVTINKGGGPQSSIVWIGHEGGEIVSAHLANTYTKHRNLARDPRISITVVLPTINDWGLQHYAVFEGTAVLIAGGGAELLQRLAHVYLGPGVTYPGSDAPDGYVLRTSVTKIRGVFPWESKGRPKGKPSGWRD
jgi:PPOX class probable F420-dependent enzyme